MISEDVTLRLYGSSLTGVGLKGSDVNVDVSGDGPAPSLLIKVFTIIQDKGGVLVCIVSVTGVCECACLFLLVIVLLWISPVWGKELNVCDN